MIGRRKIVLLSAIGIGAFVLVHFWPHRPIEIIPCVTSIDNADFNDPEQMQRFLDKAVPRGSEINCAKNVMKSKNMTLDSEGYFNLNHKSYGYIYHERWRLRFRIWSSIGYDKRQIVFIVEDKNPNIINIQKAS